MRMVYFAGLLAMTFMCALPGRAHAGTVQCQVPNLFAQACQVDPTLDPAALCNDGTVPVFWYRPGSGAGANTWVIWLQGGSECDDQPSCALRASKSGASTTMSSNGFTADQGQGIISPKSSINPALYNATTVLLHYCSSDTWAGNKAGSGLPFNPNDSTTWSFQGRRIAIAQMRSIAELVPAFAQATKVILGGDSSGGVGITLTVNDLLPLVPAAATKVFVNDAGFSLDIGQFYNGGKPTYVYPGHPNAFETQVTQRLLYWNARGDAVCDAAAITATDHQNCYDTAYVLQHGFITLPSYVAISLLDTAQITLQLCPTNYGYCPVQTNPAKPGGIYATNFGTAMAAKVTGTGTQAAYSSYAPDFYTHVILNSDTAFVTAEQFPGGGLAPRDAFDAWLANPTGPVTTYIGNAPGVN